MEYQSEFEMWVERYLEDFRTLSPSYRNVALAYQALLGFGGYAGSSKSFSGFLAASGATKPTLAAITQLEVDAYSTYLLQHHGINDHHIAMGCLSGLWRWCESQCLLPTQSREIRFPHVDVQNPFIARMHLNREIPEQVRVRTLMLVRGEWEEKDHE